MQHPSDLETTPRRLEEVRKAVYRHDLAVLPYYEIVVDRKAIRYSAAEDSRLVYARVASIFAKEPTTIPYLESFAEDDVLLDIGANIGMYSIYAAVMTGCKVYAVEPEALNYAELNKNIYLNGLHDRMLAFCCAASTGQSIGPLLLGAFGTGYSHHDFGENSWRKDTQVWSKTVSVKRDERISQGSLSVSIDHLVESGAILPPTHIKIDVDGLEPKVIAGAARTLQSPKLKTVLVEIDFGIDSSQAIIEAMVDMGWKYSLKQLITNKAMIMKEERVGQLREIKKDGFNYIFYKDEKYDRLFSEFLSRYDPPYYRGEDAKLRLKHSPRLVDDTGA